MNRKRVQVLIVEDEFIAAESLALDLRRAGFEVMGIVSSGQKAIELTQHQQPDVILMDILLQGDMDGITASQIILKDYPIPTIYMTAYSDRETILRSQWSPLVHYLVKPVTPANLIQLLNHLAPSTLEGQPRYRLI